MSSIEEYERQARRILDKRYGIHRNPPPGLEVISMTAEYEKSEITETVSQLMMRDFLSELRELAGHFSYDSDGCLLIKEGHHPKFVKIS